MNRHSTVALLAAACCAVAAPIASAQGYPAKPIRIVVPFPAGGTSDILARSVGQKLAEEWKQQIVVDNRPGAGANIGGHLAGTRRAQFAAGGDREGVRGQGRLMPISSRLSA